MNAEQQIEDKLLLQSNIIKAQRSVINKLLEHCSHAEPASNESISHLKCSGDVQRSKAALASEERSVPLVQTLRLNVCYKILYFALMHFKYNLHLESNNLRKKMKELKILETISGQE